MANTQSGQAWYVDTAHSTSAEDLIAKNIFVTGVVVTSTGATGRIVLADVTTAAVIVDLRVAAENGAAAGASRFFDFSNNPLQFANGIKVSTLTTAVATVIGRQVGQG